MRGAWIEIERSRRSYVPAGSLPMRGAWIEMSAIAAKNYAEACRSPCGERGLKFSA